MKANILFFSAFMIGLTSCDSLLNKEPEDFIAPETYYNTEDQLNYALNGVYDILGYTYGQVRLYRMGMECDEGYYTRTTPVTGPQAYDLSSSDATVSSMWTNWYVGINRANVLLENVDKNPEIEQEVRHRIKGEALFLRAYYYFLLVQTFEGVPLILKSPTSLAELQVPRSTVKEVYDQILKDMKEAEPLVAGISTLGFGGRVNKSAVRGILARVCLYMAGYPLKDVSKYAEARDWAKKVMDDSEANHSLNPSYAQVFINYAQDKYDVTESIFEVEYWGNKTDAYQETGYNGYVNGPKTSNATIGSTYGGVRQTSFLYSLYEPGDMRRDWAVASFTYNNTTGAKSFITSTTITNLFNRDCGKFRREYELVLPKVASATPQNFPVLRYSDVLLMFAEAENEVNGEPTQAAYDAVNLVRLRAWPIGGIKSLKLENLGANYTSAPTVTFSDSPGTMPVATTTINTTSKKLSGIKLAPDGVTGLQYGSGYTTPPTINISGGGGSGATATATIFTEEDAKAPQMDKVAFREFIQKERARELCFETLRKPDLIRWEIFLYQMEEIRKIIQQNNPTAFYMISYRNASEKHLVWPIPARELTTNKKLTQNVNW